jgi:putative transposase
MGADGAFAALRDAYPGAGEQPSGCRRSANVLDTLPTRLQARAKTRMHEIMRRQASVPRARRARAVWAELEAKHPKPIVKLDPQRPPE